MKTITKITTAVLLMTLLFSTLAFAASPTPANSSKVNWKKAEQNYIVALCSDNIGLRYSAANFIAQYRLTGAVQDLISVLHHDKVEQIRMAAALALVQIGGKEGRDAVAESAIYDGSEKVAKFCEQLIGSLSQELSYR